MVLKDSRINIFFLAYELPPLQTGGVYRPLYFIKYLRDLGINPIILTLHHDDIGYRWPRKGRDHSLAKILDGYTVIQVHESREKIPFYKIALSNGYQGGNEHITWKKNLYFKVDELFNSYRPEAIFATGPPFTILELGVQIAKKYQLPLISDLRDAWSQWNYKPYNSKIQYYLTLRSERRVLKRSTAIIATSSQTIHDLQKAHPKIPVERFHLITNGFDQKVDFTDKVKIKAANKIRIGYVGSFYYNPDFRGFVLNPWWKKVRKDRLSQPFIFQYVPKREDWLYRSPYFFFKSIKALLAEHPKLISCVEICFVGTKDKWFDPMVEEFGLENVVQHLGRMSIEKSHDFQKKCDFLLLTSAKVLNGLDYSIAGKTFEYFTMKTPILGYVCNGAQKDILEKSGLAIILNPDEPNICAERLFDLFTKDNYLEPNNDFLQTLHRRFLTSKLSDIIQQSIT